MRHTSIRFSPRSIFPFLLLLASLLVPSGIRADLVITEFLAVNEENLADEDGDHSD